MIVINELHPVCSHLQRLHIVCIVKARLIREIVKVIIWVGETNDYCYIWVGRRGTIIIRSIQDAKNTASLHKYAKNWLSGKFIGGNDLEMQYFAKKERWFERFWRWNFSILMQLLCSFQLHPAFKSVRICQMLPQNLKFKEKGVFCMNTFTHLASSVNLYLIEYFIIFTLAVWCGKSDWPTESQEY